MNESHLLVPEDILDLPGFVRALCDSEEAVSRRLMRLLERGLVNRLRRSRHQGVVAANTAKDLLADLNRLIEGRSIYSKAAFEYVRLTAQTARRVRGGRSRRSFAPTNRLLLTEAYPAFVRLVYPHRTEEWYSFHVGKCRAYLSDNQLYADALRSIISDACRVLAPYAVIEVRVKSVSSFAEKVWRRGYTNPICQNTDPVGARIIAETQAQVEDVCEYIKHAFLVDTANSVDHRDRLKADQFGYLSVHYVVMPRKEQIDDLERRGILKRGSWPALKGRKAEVQVRTMLQHAHATICHDRVYKSPFTVPESIQRDLARVAALLEQGDSAFGQAVERVSAYAGSYGAYQDAERRDQGIENLRAALEHEPDKTRRPEIALELAVLEKAVWEWKRVARVLRPFRSTPCQVQPRVWMEYGYATCRANQDNPRGASYREGVRKLERAADALASAPAGAPKHLAIQALSHLAWAYGNRNNPGDVRRARDAYRRAYVLDRSDPYNLASYLEFEVSMGVERGVVSYMRETLLEAAARCREHARAGVELPWAYLTMGRLYLLAERPYESLAAYCKAIHLCVEGGRGVCYPREILDDERRFLRNIGKRGGGREEDRWVMDLLDLALCVRYGAADARRRVWRRRIRAKDLLEPVIIVSGGTHPDVQGEMRSYKDCLWAGFEDFSGTLVSGGTRVGIPGLVGELVARLRARGRDSRARCYLPAKLPSDAPYDNRYKQAVRKVGDKFSPQQPLQTWIDIVGSGIESSRVKLLGINGGPLTAFEFKLAMALGAQVGVIRESGRAAEELAPDEDWQDVGNLLWLPCDPMTVRAFVDKGVPEEVPPHVLLMARRIHQSFLDSNWPRSKDRIMRPWEHLDWDIRADNIGQAAYAEEILGRAGYEVRLVRGKIKVYQFGPDEDELVEQMGEMEHGRWNVQRLRTGWKYGKQKDEDKCISPFLRPWRELPEKTKEWDREFVRQWPELLAECGMEVSRP